MVYDTIVDGIIVAWYSVSQNIGSWYAVECFSCVVLLWIRLGGYEGGEGGWVFGLVCRGTWRYHVTFDSFFPH